MKTISWGYEADVAEADRLAAERAAMKPINLCTMDEARFECLNQLSVVRRLLAADLAAPIHDVAEINALLTAERRLRYELALLTTEN